MLLTRKQFAKEMVAVLNKFCRDIQAERVACGDKFRLEIPMPFGMVTLVFKEEK